MNHNNSMINLTFLNIYKAAMVTMFYVIVIIGNIIGLLELGFVINNRFTTWLICDALAIIFASLFYLANRIILSFLYVYKEINWKLSEIEKACDKLLPKTETVDQLHQSAFKMIDEETPVKDKKITDKGKVKEQKWHCPWCGRKNPSYETKCQHCYYDPATGQMPSFYKTLLTWDCPECGNHNPYTNYSCRICNHIFKNSL